MTTTEMIYVLDKEKECIQRRTNGDCQKHCTGCDCFIQPCNLIDAFERITNFIFNVGGRSTRKSY